MSSTPIKHYLQFSDLSPEGYEYLLDRARILKAKFKNYETWHPLRPHAGHDLRKEFDAHAAVLQAGIHQLGGHAVFLNTRDSQLGRGEPIEDAAQVISRMVDIIMIRTFGGHHRTLCGAFARAGHQRPDQRIPSLPVLADVFTYIEKRGSIQGKTVAGSATPTTWPIRIRAAERLDFQFHFSAPPGYQLDPAMVPATATAHLKVFDDPLAACQSADTVTTDVWTSGLQAENETRKRAFQRWMVTTAMMDRANADALFMHCLPAHRGEEVEAAVIDGPKSVVWEEAENRLHVQKALMEYLLCGRY